MKLVITKNISSIIAYVGWCGVVTKKDK